MPPSSAPRNAPRIAGCVPTVATNPLTGTPYRALRRVGRGGMGEVFEAEHRALGKRVMIKLLHAEHAGRRDLEDRLRLEAQTLARLAHPNVVAVHDMGRTAGGRGYLVMERLEGRTLGEALSRRGAFPWPEALDIACQVLDALQAAHAVGVVHRDVKLDNVLLCAAPEPGRRWRPKLLDFGIAKVVSPDAAGLAPVAFRTDDEVAVGTPRFFSPEQALGNRVDARTDVYGAAIVLHALLAGRGPFDHLGSAGALARAHTTLPPPPASRWAPGWLPRELDRALLRALAKQPAHRPPSAAAFAQQLRDIAARNGFALPAAAGVPASLERHAAGTTRRGAAATKRGRPQARALSRGGAICLVILVASVVAFTTGSALGRLEARRQRDFVERSRSVASMDAGPRDAPVKGGTR